MQERWVPFSAAGCCVIDMGIMFVCVSVLGLPDKVIKILANVVVIILNYLFSKLFIFKKDHPARQ